MTKLRRFAAHGSTCNLEQLVVSQNVEGRPVETLRFAIAPIPKGAQYRRFPATSQARAADSPYLFHVAFSIDCSRCHRALTRLLEPLQSIAPDQFLLQLLGQGEQVMRVVARIFLHLLGERT